MGLGMGSSPGRQGGEGLRSQKRMAGTCWEPGGGGVAAAPRTLPLSAEEGGEGRGDPTPKLFGGRGYREREGERWLS
jgi:hypothetical protein